MSGDAVKAYVYLLSQSWLETPRATLPATDHELASIAMLTIEQWQAVKKDVLQHFEIGKCKEHKGLLYNEKLLEISRKYESNQRVGNKNAKRTRKKRELNALLDNANANDNDNSTIPEYKNEYKRALEMYIEKREIRSGRMADGEVKELIAELNKLAGDDIKKRTKILKQSIAQDWKGLHPLKEKKGIWNLTT